MQDSPVFFYFTNIIVYNHDILLGTRIFFVNIDLLNKH